VPVMHRWSGGHEGVGGYGVGRLAAWLLGWESIGLSWCSVAARWRNTRPAELAVKDKKFEPAEIRRRRTPHRDPHHQSRHHGDGIREQGAQGEKVIAANGEGIVRVGPLKPGKYEFFDDFNQANRGTLVVE